MKRVVYLLSAAVLSIATLQNLQAQGMPAKLWDTTMGGCGTDQLTSIQQTSDGGYILGGYSISTISGQKSQDIKGATDYWIVKLDAFGNKQWDKTIGGNNVDDLMGLQQTSDGGYILGGWTGSGISGDKTQASKGGHDFWVAKLDANGIMIWDKTLGGIYNEYLSCLQQTSDGGYIIGGMSTSPIGGDKSQNSDVSGDYWVVKLDNNGNKQWDKSFSYGIEWLKSLQQTSDGGYILGGWSDSGGGSSAPNSPRGGRDYWVVKLDANGISQWDKRFGGTGQDELNSLQQTTDGGYILGGKSASGTSVDKSQPSKGFDDYWVIKLSATGSKQWEKSFGGSGVDQLYSLQQTSDGGYLLGGSSDSNISADKSQNSKGGADYWIVKVDASGNKQWDKTFGGTQDDNLYSLKLVNNGDLVLAGSSMSPIGGDKTTFSEGDWDYWVVKLGAGITGVAEEEVKFPISVFPNPSQGKFKLKLNNVIETAVELTISDVLGRVVVQQTLPVIGNQIAEELNLPNAKSIYLLKLKVGNLTVTRKVIVE